MKLLLFGVALDLDAQGNYHGPLGTGSWSAGTAVVIAQPAADRVSIDFTGPLPFASNVSFACVCAVTPGNPLSLHSVISVTRKASAQLVLPLGLQTLKIENGDVIAVGSSDAGLGLFAAPAQLRSALKLVSLSETLRNSDWVGNANWTWRSILTFHAKEQTASFLPGDGLPAMLSIVDEFLDATATPFLSRRQTLDFVSATLDVNRVVIRSTPRDKALLLHPDILDCRQDGNSGSNSFLYQYVMVNGDLEITLEGALGKQATFAWKPTSRPNSPTTNAGMLLFRHGDEHGHPVLLEGELFPIGFREGSSVQKDSTITATEWEWTNRAVCVYKEDGDISVEVRAIDPLKIRTYDNPDWLAA